MPSLARLAFWCESDLSEAFDEHLTPILAHHGLIDAAPCPRRKGKVFWGWINSLSSNAEYLPLAGGSLCMPFLYLPGNHDIGISVMADVWGNGSAARITASSTTMSCSKVVVIEKDPELAEHLKRRVDTAGTLGVIRGIWTGSRS
jgi:hypothetical protein